MVPPPNADPEKPFEVFLITEEIMEDTTEYLAFAKQLAYQAGDIMKKYFMKNPALDFKADSELVTIADTEVNSLVIAEVTKKYPEHSVDGEEEASNPGSKYVWVCDPIDGTNPFAMGLPISVFSIAFVVDGKPVVGVIYDPYYDRLYWAAEGTGAFMNDNPIKVRKDNFSQEITQRVNVDWWIAAEFDILAPLQKLAIKEKLFLLSPGSTAHMGALVARGEFLASVFAGSKGKNVDIAAQKVIVEEAGGKVTDLFGNEQRYDQAIKGAVVSNGVVHDTIVEALKDALEKKS